MKVLFAGLGSIGSRHLKNSMRVLDELGVKHEFYALRSSHRPLESAVEGCLSKSYFQIDDLPGDFDVAFVTNPTSEHDRMIEALKHRADHLFIEKPLFETCSCDLNRLPPAIGSIHYVACPLRHTLLFQKLSEICQSETIRGVRAICSSYLPDWRPDADYRKTYSARAALGGGVDLDLIHELDYLTALFSFPDKIYSVKGHFSALEIDCCDTACYLARYPSMAMEIRLDYLGRVSRREVELYTDSDVIIGDFVKKEIRFLKQGTRIDLNEERDDWCRRELSYFYRLCLGREMVNINDPARAYRNLQLALGGK